MKNNDHHSSDKDLTLIEAPPILKSWQRLYGVVIGFLLLQIAFYYLLTVLLNESA